VIALAVEFGLVVAWFVWAYRCQVRDRQRKEQPPAKQLSLPLERDREVGS
jgi:hypothetical protein